MEVEYDKRLQGIHGQPDPGGVGADVEGTDHGADKVEDLHEVHLAADSLRAVDQETEVQMD